MVTVDHTAEALTHLGHARNVSGGDWSDEQAHLAYAAVHAQLAVAAEIRAQNVIAMALHRFNCSVTVEESERLDKFLAAYLTAATTPEGDADA